MHLNLPHPILRVVDKLLAIKRFFLVVASLVLSLVFLFVVVLRYLFQADLFAYEEWVLMLAFWLYFLGAAMGSYENSHVKADFLLSLITNLRIKWLFVNLTLLIEVAVGAVLTYWGWLMLEEELVAYPDWQRTTALSLPFAIPKLGIFLGFLLMTFYAFLHLLSGVREGPDTLWEENETPPHL